MPPKTETYDVLPGDFVEHRWWPKRCVGRVMEIGMVSDRLYAQLVYNLRTHTPDEIIPISPLRILEYGLTERELPRIGSTMPVRGWDLDKPGTEGTLERITMRQGQLRYHVRSLGRLWTVHPEAIYKSSTRGNN